MKTQGRSGVPSGDVINAAKMSPDERQNFNDAQYFDAIKSQIKTADSPPMPRVDPRDKMPNTGMGGGQTYGQFDQMLATEGAVNRYTEDLTRADYKRYALGYNDANDYAKKHGPTQYKGAAEFLLDTFKRAREVGYPIHPLVPYLTNQLPMAAFEGQAGK